MGLERGVNFLVLRYFFAPSKNFLDELRFINWQIASNCSIEIRVLG